MAHRSTYFLILPAVLLVTAFFVFPIANVLLMSVTEPTPGLGNFRELIDNELIHRVWWNTFRICVATTVIAVGFGYLVAYAMAHVGERHRTTMIACVMVTFWLSVLIRSFAWLVLLRGSGVVNSFLMEIGLIDAPLRLVRNEIGVLIGMAHYMLPVAILPLYSNMRNISGRYVDAARSLGAGPLRAFMLVYLPLTKPGVIAAAILVFIISLGYYITPAILGGGRVVMIAEYIRVGFDETLQWGRATMLASTLLFVVVALLVLFSRVVDIKKVFGS